VWKLDDERALVVTADFITPLVDDARTWGRIAAANAVSDVYAMGGRPLLALNLVCWNRDELDLELLGDVLEGAASIGAEGGFVIAGGHTVDDPEPKFGLAVVGEVHPERLLTNAGLRAGQALVLTKALGIGVTATAIKQDEAPPGLVEAAVESMCRLNDEAARVALAAGATGATDVTGFGLLGHLGRAAVESGVDVVLDVAAVPFLDGARQLAAAGIVPGGSRRNLDWVRPRLDPGGVDDVAVLLLADAQTSGGLVFGVDPDRVDEVVAELVASGHAAARIGVTAPGQGHLTLR
jgi:selenide, water dikinase